MRCALTPLLLFALSLPLHGEEEGGREEWPRLLVLEGGGRVVLHLPQLEEWKEFRDLGVRLAATVELPRRDGGVDEAAGTIRLAMTTRIDIPRRIALVSAPTTTEFNSPTLDEARRASRGSRAARSRSRRTSTSTCSRSPARTTAARTGSGSPRAAPGEGVGAEAGEDESEAANDRDTRRSLRRRGRQGLPEGARNVVPPRRRRVGAPVPQAASPEGRGEAAGALPAGRERAAAQREREVPPSVASARPARQGLLRPARLGMGRRLGGESPGGELGRRRLGGRRSWPRRRIGRLVALPRDPPDLEL